MHVILVKNLSKMYGYCFNSCWIFFFFYAEARKYMNQKIDLTELFFIFINIFLYLSLSFSKHCSLRLEKLGSYQAQIQVPLLFLIILLFSLIIPFLALARCIVIMFMGSTNYFTCRFLFYFVFHIRSKLSLGIWNQLLI